jgi:phenylacetate-CoA ligase
MFVHPSQVQKVLENHSEIAKGRLVVDRRQDRDSMTLEIELKGSEPEGFVKAVEDTLRDVTKLKGSVLIVKPGYLSSVQKTIEDIRKWD